MKRLALVATLAALGTAAFAAWSLAATSGGAGPTASASPQGAKQRLPRLPAEVRSRRRWVIGVKCDFPPFGYINVRGRNAGYDVEVARWFARFAFGNANKVNFVCVTTPSRIPALQTKRVDIIISTLTWTSARAEIIDFSIPYYSATGRLLVKSDSSIRRLNDIRGKTVVTTRGALYATWIRNCFRNTNLLEVDSPSAALLAVNDGRADTFMFDDAFLLGVATVDRNVRLTPDKFLAIPWGIGIRKGEVAMKRWVDSRLRIMKKRDLFARILRNNAPSRLIPSFLGNVPRPKNTFRYPIGRNPTSECP